jgi:hypothetical protein
MAAEGALVDAPVLGDEKPRPHGLGDRRFEEDTPVSLGVEAVRTLGLAVDNGVEPFGDGLVDHAL